MLTAPVLCAHPRLSGQGVLFTFSLLSPCIILSRLSGQILAPVEGAYRQLAHVVLKSAWLRQQQG